MWCLVNMDSTNSSYSLKKKKKKLIPEWHQNGYRMNSGHSWCRDSKVAASMPIPSIHHISLGPRFETDSEAMSCLSVKD